MSEFIEVCRVGDIPEGSGKSFPIGHEMVGVFLVDGEYYAIDDRCPHAEASLARGTLKSDQDAPVVRCRIHNWGFCLKSGKYVDAELPRFNARTFPLRIVDNSIQVLID